MLDYSRNKLVPKASVLISEVSLLQGFGTEGFHYIFLLFIKTNIYNRSCPIYLVGTIWSEPWKQLVILSPLPVTIVYTYSSV